MNRPMHKPDGDESAITLDRQHVVAFLGSMNAMPMAYAHALKKLGYSCLYFVDVPRRVPLCRPENFFPDISYPYPHWIQEIILPSQYASRIPIPRKFTGDRT